MKVILGWLKCGSFKKAENHCASGIRKNTSELSKLQLASLC